MLKCHCPGAARKSVPAAMYVSSLAQIVQQGFNMSNLGRQVTMVEADARAEKTPTKMFSPDIFATMHMVGVIQAKHLPVLRVF